MIWKARAVSFLAKAAKFRKGAKSGSMKHMEPDFEPAGIRYSSYPFPPASVFPSGVVAPEAIAEVDIEATPPEVRLRSGETLFVSAVKKDALRVFAFAHNIELVQRVDIWGWISEPWVDVQHEQSELDNLVNWLGECGVSKSEVLALWQQLNAPMHAYNIESGLWDWVHLGLCSVLDALMGTLSGEIHKLDPVDFQRFYWEAMRIARLAPTRKEWDSKHPRA